MTACYGILHARLLEAGKGVGKERRAESFWYEDQDQDQFLYVLDGDRKFMLGDKIDLVRKGRASSFQEKRCVLTKSKVRGWGFLSL